MQEGIKFDKMAGFFNIGLKVPGPGCIFISDSL